MLNYKKNIKLQIFVFKSNLVILSKFDDHVFGQAANGMEMIVTDMMKIDLKS